MIEKYYYFLLLLHNGGFCNNCTLATACSYRCIYKQTHYKTPFSHNGNMKVWNFMKTTSGLCSVWIHLYIAAPIFYITESISMAWTSDKFKNVKIPESHWNFIMLLHIYLFCYKFNNNTHGTRIRRPLLSFELAPSPSPTELK